MCHQTLKSLSRAVRRMPKTLMRTWGTMRTTMTVSWKYQLVAEPRSGTAASGEAPAMRVTAPTRYVAAATLIPAVIVTWPTMLSTAGVHAHVRTACGYGQQAEHPAVGR